MILFLIRIWTKVLYNTGESIVKFPEVLFFRTPANWRINICENNGNNRGSNFFFLYMYLFFSNPTFVLILGVSWGGWKFPFRGVRYACTQFKYLLWGFRDGDTRIRASRREGACRGSTGWDVCLKRIKELLAFNSICLSFPSAGSMSPL